MPGQNSRNSRFTKQLDEIVNSNMNNERFGVSELANKMNMSRSNLHRKIKSATGGSVSQYLRKVRLHKAMELLKEQTLTVSEVAFAVGFGSVNYFSNCFKEHFGFAPSEVENYPEDEKDHQATQENKNIFKNFPIQNTSFIGREKEIKTIINLVCEHRIVSLIGTGGCGKTRLACQVVSKLEKEYKDGIWFVNLAPVESEELVAKQLLNTLEIAEVPGKTIEEVLLDNIKSKELLILLDNCEHLLSGSAKLAAKLIQEVPGLSIITTSRKALNVNGEKTWPIPPLSLVDPSKISNLDYVNQSEAVRLFTDRALLNNRGFKLTNENSKEVALVCQKVDGIPLAIELVASRTKYLDVKTMISRFEGRLAKIPSMDLLTVDRHKTLEATIEWSYNLLNEEEQMLFRSLSVFAGGFDLDAAEEVCSNKFLTKERILDILSGLIDTSLVQTYYTEDRKMRYNVLETLHQYGLKILSEKKENQEISRKHLDYFSGMAEQAFDERMSNQVFWLDKIRLEQNNFSSALTWEDINEPEKFQRLAANLSWFWGRLNNFSAAIRILEKVNASETIGKETRARLYTGYGALLFTTAAFQKAADMLNQGAMLWKELKNKKEESLTLANLSDLLHAMGDFEPAMKYAREAYKLAKELNNPGVELNAITVVVTGLVFTKKTQEALPLVKKAVLLAEEQQNLFLITVTRHLLGDCGLINGQYHESEWDYGLSLKAALKYGDTSYACMQITSIAMSVAGQGRHVKALRLNAAATKIAQSLKLWVPEEVPVAFWKELVNQHIVGIREKLGEELTFKTEAQGRNMNLEEAAKYALDFEMD